MVGKLGRQWLTGNRLVILIARTVATKTTNAVLPSVQLYTTSMVTGEKTDEQNHPTETTEVEFEYLESFTMR